MSTVENHSTDIEGGGRRRSRPSVAGSSEATTDGSRCFSESDDRSWHSPLDSNARGSFGECRFLEIEGISGPRSHKVEASVSDRLSYDVDLESGDLELKVQPVKEERDCRICHLNLVGDTGNQEIGIAIELGCSCKGDLGASHKQCAETWFKLKGNTTCEICGATALNVIGVQTNEANSTSATASAAPVILAETRSFWDGRRVMNFLLACMVFAFVISWLCHFNILP